MTIQVGSHAGWRGHTELDGWSIIIEYKNDASAASPSLRRMLAMLKRVDTRGLLSERQNTEQSYQNENA